MENTQRLDFQSSYEVIVELICHAVTARQQLDEAIYNTVGIMPAVDRGHVDPDFAAIAERFGQQLQEVATQVDDVSLECEARAVGLYSYKGGQKDES
ncbi:MAG: hypothetical protein IJ113_03960 [Eggerthellaceae bacterium]|nr:hypothetical protein [Eggerthellaceae bacterium]